MSPRRRWCWWCAYPDQPPPPCRVCGSHEYFSTGYCQPCHPRTVVARSCARCWAWGVHDGRWCKACDSFDRRYPEGACASCHRWLHIKDRFCRLCRQQARLEAGLGYHAKPNPEGVATRGLQLFLSHMQDALRPALAAPDARLTVLPLGPTRSESSQLELFSMPHDLTRVDRVAQPPADPAWLEAVLLTAATIAAARGWSPDTRREVRRALAFLLPGHRPGVSIPASTVQTLADQGMAVERPSEVLAELGLLQDDLPSTLDAWLASKLGPLGPLGPRMRDEVDVWVDSLRYGDRRTRPRRSTTVCQYVLVVAPLLVAWSKHHASLREITQEAIKQAVQPVHGSRRATTLIALRSLFGLLKKRRLIFANPTTRIRVGRTATVPVPLDQRTIDQAVDAATTPAARLVLALTAVQALSTTVMRQLLLTDVDLGQRRLRVRGQDRPLDDFTRQVIEDYLVYRQQRWPNTANPHLLLTQQTAHETGPASPWWFKRMFRSQPATITRLRQDRVLEELRAVGPDPLHVAAVFGMHSTTATCYADAVRSRVDEAAAAMQDAEHLPAQHPPWP